MILFIQSTAVLHKNLNNELKYFICYNFSLRLHRIHRIPWEFPEFFMFRETPEYSSFSRFSRFVATLVKCVVYCLQRSWSTSHSARTAAFKKSAYSKRRATPSLGNYRRHLFPINLKHQCCSFHTYFKLLELVIRIFLLLVCLLSS